MEWTKLAYVIEKKNPKYSEMSVSFLFLRFAANIF